MSITTDNPKLAEITERCFLLSTSTRLAPQQRDQFRELGEHLRSKLMILLSKTFTEGTPALIAANQQIAHVNAELKKATEDLAKIANRIEQVASLVSTIDGLLKIPLSFI